MRFNFNGIKVFYQFKGDENGPLTLFLHGWGCDGNSFEKIIENFPSRRFLLVDCPPFGKSKQEPSGWTIFTYTSMIISLCESLNIKKIDIVGHSFGGRICILLAALNKELVRSCVLIDSAGLKPKRSMKYYFKVYSYKAMKKMGFAVVGFGSSDYRSLSPNMQIVFKNVVNQYLDEYLPLVKAKTLIIFGEDDNETPIYMAKKLHKKIDGSRLVIIKNAGHFSFYDNSLKVVCALSEFWKEEQ